MQKMRRAVAEGIGAALRVGWGSAVGQVVWDRCWGVFDLEGRGEAGDVSR